MEDLKAILAEAGLRVVRSGGYSRRIGSFAYEIEMILDTVFPAKFIVMPVLKVLARMDLASTGGWANTVWVLAAKAGSDVSLPPQTAKRGRCDP